MRGGRDNSKAVERSLPARVATASAFLLGLVCLVGAIYCHIRYSEQYEAQALLCLDPFVPDISNTNNVVAALEPRSVQPYRNTLAQVLDSTPVARGAARHLLASGETRLLDTLGRDEEALTQAIRSMTRVLTPDDDAALVVVCSHAQADLPPVCANAVADAFIVMNMGNRLAPYSNAVDAITREVERLGIVQVDHVTELEVFQEKTRAEDVDSRRASLVAQLTKARSDFAQASHDRQLAEADWDAMASVSADALYQIDVIANDSRAVAAREALVKQVAQVRVLEERYGEKHPRLIAAIAAQESLRADMIAVCSEVREGAAERLQSARAREKQIQSVVGDAENGLRTLGVIIREEAALEARANAAIVNLDRMRERLYDARLALSLVVNDVQIIDRATAPKRPRRDPMGRRLLVLAFTLTALGLVLGRVSRPRARRVPIKLMRDEDTSLDAPLPADPVEDTSIPSVLRAAPEKPLPQPGPAAGTSTLDEVSASVRNRDTEPPRLVSALPVTAVIDAEDASGERQPEEHEPSAISVADTLDSEPVPETIDYVEPEPAEIQDTTEADAPAVDDPPKREYLPEVDDPASDAFWAKLKHPTLDELESAAVNAAENVGEAWTLLLSHVVAAQDRDRLVRLARDLRMTRPFGDRVRRLAEGHLARVRDDFEGAAQIYSAGLVSAADASDLRGGLARCQLFLGDGDGLQATLADAGEPQADIAYVRGMLAMEDGDQATARTHLRACITLVPDIEAMICLAWIAIREERFRLAEKSVRYALNLSPNHVGALDLLGVILYRQGHTGEAMRVFEKALVHAPEAWGTMIHLVELYQDTGESRKATGLIRRLRANRDRLDEEWVGVLEQLESGISGAEV